jgi:heme-degrading monooxygenase HmoA
MFARKVTACLKPNTLSEFTSIVEKEILPWLRRQEGFVDLIVLVIRGIDEVTTISFWQHEANAQAWATGGFPEAAKILERLLDGASYLKTFDVVSSTVHELAASTQV